MIYTATFNPAIDYIVHMDKLIPGQVNRAAKNEIYYGGKGINISCVLKALGLDSIALGFAAGFTGEELLKGLESLGVTTDFIMLDQGLTRINVKIKAESETDINGPGPKIGDDELEQFFAKLEKLVPGDVLCLAGSIPSALPENIYQSILEKIDGRGVLTAVDATGDLLVNVLKYKPFLIKPNNFEISEIFGREIKTDEDTEFYAKKLIEAGARNVLVSMAGDGAMLVCGNGDCHRIGAPKGKVINSVGAGDSMVAGFIFGYLKTNDPLYALKMGTAAGSATAFSPGLASRELVNSLFNTL